MEERLRDVEETEKGVQEQLEEIKRKEEDFGLKERDFEKHCRDVESSENRLQKDLELKSEQCEEIFRELKLMEESVKTKFEELGEKEVELGFKMINFEQRSGDLIMEEKSLKKDRQDLEAKRKRYEECLREIELKEKLLEESSQELARKYNLQFEDLECKAKNYDQRCMELKLKEKSVKDQFSQIEAKEEQLALKERHLEQRLKFFELNEKYLDADELVKFLVFVAQHIQTPELFKVLGLGDKITGLIRIRVEKKQHMEAIRFIYAFEQVNEFPPVPVLRDFLNHSWTESEEILEKGEYTPEAQSEARTKRIADLRAVVKCIEDHKLESEYLPQNVENLKDFIVSLTSLEAYPALCAAPEAESETPPQQHFGIRPRESIDIEMSSKHLKGSEQVTPKGPGTSRNVKKKTGGRKENALVLHERHGGTKSSSARSFAKFECYDFKREKSEDKFQVDQIWALYSGHGMPKEYAQVKKIESTPVFKLHVAPLQVCSSSKDLNQPLCCGIFKVNCRQTEVISCNVVSHQPRAEPIGKGRYAIYPRKGEVWAIYKSLDSEAECDIVEVVEDDAECKKVVVLSSVDVSKSLYMAPRSLRSKAGGVIEIPETKYARFSHQIPTTRRRRYSLERLLGA